MATAPKITIKAATEAIRAQRKVQFLSDDPFTARVKNTAGDGWHYVSYQGGELLSCDTCLSRFGRDHCWAVDRVVAALRGHVERVAAEAEAKASKEPVEPKKLTARSWNAIHRESLTVLDGGKEES